MVGTEVDIIRNPVRLSCGIAVPHQHEYPVGSQGTAVEQGVLAGFHLVNIINGVGQL